MAIVINTKSYARDVNATANSVPYIGPSNTVSAKDKIDALRTPPKPVSTHSGIARSEGRLTRTYALTGAKTPSAEAQGRILANIPVGMASADVDTFLTDLAAYAASAEFKTLAKTHVFAS